LGHVRPFLPPVADVETLFWHSERQKSIAILVGSWDDQTLDRGRDAIAGLLIGLRHVAEATHTLALLAKPDQL
jgi:hypothetical protein